MVMGTCNPRRLRQENHLNLRGSGHSEPRLCHCTPVWAIDQDSISKQNKTILCMGQGGSCLISQHSGRLEREDLLRPAWAT